MKNFLLPCTLLIVALLLMLSPYLYRANSLLTLRNKYYTPPVEFKKILKHFQEYQARYEKELFVLPVVYEDKICNNKGSSYTIELASKPLKFNKIQAALKNPFSANSFPLSYSVIFQGNLVALFYPGYFACYHISNLKRNKKLENLLNSQKFQYHWVLNNQLVALAGKRYFFFSKDGIWKPYTEAVPLGKQPKLFEDTRYVSFMTCNGEWGGEVYFYDKRSRTYYLASAMCANSVVKRNENYLIVSSLAHMIGFAELQQINDPTTLTRWSKKSVLKDMGSLRVNQDELSHGKDIFSYQGLLILSAFALNDRLVYIVNWHNATFLATWSDGVFYIVDPLFNNNIKANNPVTITYDSNLTLINIDSTEDVERACIIISGKKLVKITWQSSVAAM